MASSLLSSHSSPLLSSLLELVRVGTVSISYYCSLTEIFLMCDAPPPFGAKGVDGLCLGNSNMPSLSADLRTEL